MAWTRKILRINLTKGEITTEPLNMEWAQSYLGSRGLATKYYVEENDPMVEPLAPENKLIFATGPLTGTCASTGGRYTVVTKSPLTGTIACSNSGGYFGPELKFSGYDMVILEGKSPTPVYLSIFNDKIQLRDASHLWGKSVWDTDDAIKAEVQDPLAHVAAIGVSGEKGVLFSCIVNNKHRAAGRSGVGAVMGSKNLKAIVARGSKGVTVEDPQAFFTATDAGKEVLKANAVTGEGLPAFGTQVLMNVVNETGAMPTRNCRDIQFDGAHDISAEAMAEPRRSDGKANLSTNVGCFGCTIACGRISTIDPTHYSLEGEDKDRYKKASGGLEYEAAWALGCATGVNDLDALTYLTFLCNEHGLDPISLGSTIAAAMDLFEEGAINLETTGGLELKFGNTKALIKAVEITCISEGFGADIGLGSARLCEKYGRPELSMTVKRQEFPAYDPRGIQGMGLTYATSNRGGCHLRSYTVSSEILGIPEKTDPLATDGKAALVMAFQDATAAVDSAGLCIFTTFAWTLEDIAPQLNAACEGNWTPDTMMEVGERIWNMERKFNMDAGIKGDQDTLPDRLLKEAAKTGPAQGLVSGLDKMLPEYYELRGWSTDGTPTGETLSRLGL